MEIKNLRIIDLKFTVLHPIKKSPFNENIQLSCGLLIAVKKYIFNQPNVFLLLNQKKRSK